MVRVERIELSSPTWKAGIRAIVRYPLSPDIIADGLVRGVPLHIVEVGLDAGIAHDDDLQTG